MYCFPGGEIGKPGETLQDSSRGRGKFYKYLFREGCLSLRSLTRSPLRRWRDLQASTVACWRRSHEKIGNRSNSLVSSPLAKKTFEDVWPLASSPGSTIPPSAQAILAYGLAQFGFLSTRVAGEFFTRLTSLAFYVRKSSSACSAQASLPLRFLDFHAVLLTRREL